MAVSVKLYLRDLRVLCGSSKKKDWWTQIKRKLAKISKTSGKRNLIFNSLLSLLVKPIPKDGLKVNVITELKKSGYEKSDLFIADSLANKLERDLPLVNNRLKGIKIKNNKSVVIPENKNPVITELLVTK